MAQRIPIGMKKQPDTTYRLNPEVAARELKGQLLLLLPGERRLYTTNGTGLFIWRQLVRKAPELKIITAFQKEFAVSGEIAQRDVRRFLSQLEKKAIIAKAGAR
jgi:hypothetical protein